MCRGQWGSNSRHWGGARDGLRLPSGESAVAPATSTNEPHLRPPPSSCQTDRQRSSSLCTTRAGSRGRTSHAPRPALQRGGRQEGFLAGARGSPRCQNVRERPAHVLWFARERQVQNVLLRAPGRFGQSGRHPSRLRARQVCAVQARSASSRNPVRGFPSPGQGRQPSRSQQQQRRPSQVALPDESAQAVRAPPLQPASG